MKKALALASLTLTLLLVAPRAAFAQDGCDDSPENPTLILAGLAGGVYAVNTLRLRVRARRSAADEKR
jgi:XrtJ-associated TM-motif-TM protein